MMDFNWKDIIKKEYETLKVQYEKQLTDLWNENKAVVDKENKEKNLPCCAWEVDKSPHLGRGETVSITFFSKDTKRKTGVRSFMLPYTSPPPSMTDWTPVSRNFVSKDSEELQNLPYLGDDVMDDCFIDDLVETYNGKMSAAKEKLMDDEMFVNLVHKLIPYQDKANTAQGLQPDEIIFRSIDSYFNTSNSYDKYITLTENKLQTTPQTPNIDGPSLTQPLQPDQSLHSYRKYFCRRCFIYNCQLHPGHNIDGAEKSNFRKRDFQELERPSVPCSKTCYLWSVGTQDEENIADLAEISGSAVEESGNLIEASGNFIKEKSANFMEEISGNPFEELSGNLIEEVSDSRIKEKSGNPNEETIANPIEEITGIPIEEVSGIPLKDISGNPIEEVPGNPNKEISEPLAKVTTSENEWTFSDQTFFLALLNVFPNNSCAIAETMRTMSCEQVYQRMKKIETKPHQAEPDIKKKNHKKERPSKACDSTMHLRKSYTPCDHPGLCNKTIECPCLNCEKFCSCGPDCKKRVPKCTCKGSCITSKCICYDGHRECDPQLCTCISCKNISIQRGVEKKLQIVSSPIHGWGVAVKESCQKSEYITEYRGELISPEEAERRGKVYDKNNITYMFGLNNETVIDSMRFGSKIRFANYSTKPNCDTKVVMVNGDHRIGVFAARYIEAGEELTMDYNTYDPTKLKHAN